MTYHLPSYPKIYNFGTGHINNIFKGPVWIGEKLDGSQFSFGWDEEGNMVFRSKRVQVYAGQEDNNFGPTVNALLELEKQGKFDNYKHLTFRGEVFRSNKHNTLTYERCPKHHIVIFDIQKRDEVGANWVHPDNLRVICEDVGLEYVNPTMHDISKLEDVKQIAELPSMLGGQREGIVIKNYAQFTPVGDPQFAKYVRDVFREKNSKDFKKRNPTQKDIMYTLVEYLKSEARWNKARQHLEDSGELQFQLQDIPNLMKEVQKDVEEEDSLEIKEILFKHFWPQIKRQIVHGIPEWWKEYLANRQFEDN